MHRRIAVLIVIALIALSMLACYSTACMTNDQVLEWLDTGTPQACFSK